MAEKRADLHDSTDLGGQTVRVYPLTRIMGRADIEVAFASGHEVLDARFRALEYRGFEQMVVGMPAFRAPSLMSRVCGACGQFHQLASCMAIENATGTRVPAAASWFRELLGWLWTGVSHLLNATWMALPDFALPMSDSAVRNVVGIYAVEQETIRKLDCVQSAFSEALEILSGLAVHPAVIVPGGVSYLPDWSARTKAQVLLNGCEQDLREVLRLVEMLTRRNAQVIEEGTSLEGGYMASSGRGRPAPGGGEVTVAGFDGGEPVSMDVASFVNSLEPTPLPWSYAVPVSVSGFGPLLTGPMARVNLGFDQDSSWAEMESARTREHWGHPLDRDFLYLTAIVLEVIQAWEKALLLIEQRPRLSETCAVPAPVESEGFAVVETPRGTLAHRVATDGEGNVRNYEIFSPLQFNYLMINSHLSRNARRLVEGIDIGEAEARKLQLFVRAFSPCVPCGTH